VKRRGKSSPSALKAEHGKPHPEQGQAEPMGSLPRRVRVDRLSQRVTFDQDE